MEVKLRKQFVITEAMGLKLRLESYKQKLSQSELVRRALTKFFKMKGKV